MWIHTQISRLNEHLCQLLGKGFIAARQHKRGSFSAALLLSATLLSVTVVNGGRFTRIPNGVPFPNPTGASEPTAQRAESM